jgi:hypothetical protein
MSLSDLRVIVTAVSVFIGEHRRVAGTAETPTCPVRGLAVTTMKVSHVEHDACSDRPAQATDQNL